MKTETAGAVSLKVLAERKARGIQKSTQFQVDPRIIEIEEGFNARPIDPEHVQAMKMSMLAGTILPPLFVRVRPEDGGIIVVDGHHRLTAILALIDEGHDFKRVDCMQFRGNDADRIAHMLTSSQGKNLTPLQMGLQYRKLAAFGWNEGEIGAKVGKTRQHVHDMVLLAESNSDVQGMVARGEVAAHVAVAALRKHGSEAGNVLAGHLDTAKKAGKSKVTNKTIRKSAPVDTSKVFEFKVVFPGEESAGLRAYTEKVKVSVESGDPGGEDGEFQAHLRDALAAWFDGAGVEAVSV